MRLMPFFKRLLPGPGLEGYPERPEPRAGYRLTTADMIHFDVLDGDEECGGIEMKGGVEGEPESWVLHVYGIDLVFPSLSQARAWLGKPELRLEAG